MPASGTTHAGPGRRDGRSGLGHRLDQFCLEVIGAIARPLEGMTAKDATAPGSRTSSWVLRSRPWWEHARGLAEIAERVAREKRQAAILSTISVVDVG